MHNTWRSNSKLINALFIILFTIITIGFSNCSGPPKYSHIHKGSLPFVLGTTIPLRVGVHKLEDLRNQGAKEMMADLGDVGELITRKFCDNLKHCEVFSSVKRDDNPGNIDVILKGKVKSFEFSCYTAVGDKIMLSLAFGLIGGAIADHGKLARVSARLNIEISLYDARTGQLIRTYSEDKTFDKRDNWASDTGRELNMLFHRASAAIIRDIFSDRDKILSSVTVGSGG